MRPKRTGIDLAPGRRASRGRDHPPDATGLTIDWLGVQVTGTGATSSSWIIVALAGLRAAPYLVRRAARRLARRPGAPLEPGARGPGEGEKTVAP